MDFSHYKVLEFRRKFWVLAGAKIFIRPAGSEQIVGFIGMKAWKLKEDIRVYSDESRQQEFLRIHARNILDIAATYDVFDSKTGQLVYSLRRQGLQSLFVRDHWDILDKNGTVVGAVQETSSNLALARRYLDLIPIVGPFLDLALAFIPQIYSITVHNAPAGTITHHKNPIIVKMTLDTSDITPSTDSRLTTAITALLSIMDANK